MSNGMKRNLDGRKILSKRMKPKQTVLPDYQGGGDFRIWKCRPNIAQIIACIMKCAILGHGKNFFERQVQIHYTILVLS